MSGSSHAVGLERGHGWGGGILLFDPGSSAVMAYNVVTANSAPDIGSGVFIDDGSQALLINELIYGNVCLALGGAGLYVDGLNRNTPSAAFVVNSTIAQHACGGSTAGSAIFIEQRSAVKLRNSILWGNGGSSEIYADGSSGARASYTLLETPMSGEGNLIADPAFAAPASGDFHLQSTAGRWLPEGTGAGSWVTDAADSVGIDRGDPADAPGAETAPNGGRSTSERTVGRQRPPARHLDSRYSRSS